MQIEWLPHIDAGLNALATGLLICGYLLIKRGKEAAHRAVMLSAFGVSVVFLICYLIYHANTLSKPFPREGYSPVIRYAYLAMLLTHVVLAALVPFLAGLTIFWGLRGERTKHRRIARWTFPIWLYVSITGVLVYLVLYWLCPPLPAT